MHTHPYTQVEERGSTAVYTKCLCLLTHYARVTQHKSVAPPLLTSQPCYYVFDMACMLTTVSLSLLFIDIFSLFERTVTILNVHLVHCFYLFSNFYSRLYREEMRCINRAYYEPLQMEDNISCLQT